MPGIQFNAQADMNGFKVTELGPGTAGTDAVNLNQLNASVAAAITALNNSDGNLPVVRAGGWHLLPAYGAPGTMTPVNDRAYALPLWTGRACTMTAIATEVTLLGVGNLRYGLYDNQSGLPGNLIADYGTISTGVAGIKTIVVSEALDPVLYWLVVAQQGVISVGMRARVTGEPIVSETAANLNTNANAYYADGVSGALPATFPALGGSVQGPSATVQLT